MNADLCIEIFHSPSTGCRLAEQHHLCLLQHRHVHPRMSPWQRPAPQDLPGPHGKQLFLCCSPDLYTMLTPLRVTLTSFCVLQNEVNAIKWDPSGMLLASCSDDMTLKVRLVPHSYSLRTTNLSGDLYSVLFCFCCFLHTDLEYEAGVMCPRPPGS